MNGEDQAFLTQQLITCIGNKRALLHFIGRGVDRVAERVGRRRLDCSDLFSGSGVVARFLKSRSRYLYVNDLERYAELANVCYLANRSAVDTPGLHRNHADLKRRLESEPLRSGFITELYAPRSDRVIRAGERVFYTRRNARYLDTARRYIEELPERLRPFMLAPLLAEASVHANTAGVFKGFYKNSSTGVGQFGGNNRDALTRILGRIDLPFPVWSRFECGVTVYREDAAGLAGRLPAHDLCYLDPPYNQHPYGSNYFMLNLIADYRRPEKLSPVSGIPADWNRSPFNKPQEASAALAELAASVQARFLLVSFNSEGFVSRENMTALLRRLGRVEILETRYNAFRGSRNLGNRGLHVKEYLYLVEKK